MKRWWGFNSWHAIKPLSGLERAMLMSKRFMSELGYKFSHFYPIYEKDDGGKKMFYMIHATDHEEATELMVRAYNHAMDSLSEWQTEEMDFAKKYLRSPLTKKIKARR